MSEAQSDTSISEPFFWSLQTGCLQYQLADHLEVQLQAIIKVGVSSWLLLKGTQ